MEQTAALRILLYLLEKGKASRTDLRRSIDASISAIYNALPKLKKLGLIKEEGRKTFPFTVHVLLTPKGRKVAEQLTLVNNILTEEQP